MGISLEAEDEDIISYYETYHKKKFEYYNVYIRVQPSPAEMDNIKDEVKKQLADFKQEVEVGLMEKQLQIERNVQAGEMIPERAKL